jgi:sporulation and spore germination protein/galactose oxidase-like protein
MTKLLGLLLLAGSLGLILSGCGSEKAVSLGAPPRESAQASGATTDAQTSPVVLQVWFARGEQLVSEERTHAATPRVATAAVEALLAGPTSAERAAGVTTAIPDGTRLLGISIKDSVATVDLTSEYQSGGGSLSMQVRLGQIVYTLTQFPTIRTVRFALDGTPVNVFSGQGIVLDHPVGRADYQDLLLGTNASTGAPLAGRWSSLAASPLDVEDARTSVWTGTEMIVVGRHSTRARDGAVLSRVDVAASYDPVSNAWRRLPWPPGSSSFMNYSSVWTGKEMIVWGQGIRDAFNPVTNQWRRLPDSKLLAIHDGFWLVVWTGRDVIGWGGGCCGDAFSDGVAYNPTANSWRKVAPSPLAGSQHPIGAWTGRELVVFVGGLDPNGKPWPTRLARAAAYNPATNTWRRIAPLPAARDGANVVWDGSEVLVVGGSAAARDGHAPVAATVGFAYNPASNRWRRLPPMESGRVGAAAVWTGAQLLVWGGSQTAGGGLPVIPPHGLAYDPKANRWSTLPQAPLVGRLDPTGVWTGSALIVWGGDKPATPAGSGTKFFTDGAAFTPTTP